MTDDVPLPPPTVSVPHASPSPARGGGAGLRPLTPATTWVTAIVITVLTAGSVVTLWWPATTGLTGPDLVKARLDALKIGLSIVVGSGGAVALYLAWRRQHSTEADLDNRERALAHQQTVANDTKAHQERVAVDARTDATERRITELYLTAVEQLGSDKAPVRLGALYALERLAQDNETQRQTIVNVLCAYLRMPFQSPGEPPEDDVEKDLREQYRDQVHEREVRATAQHILTDHLEPARVGSYWEERDLNLTGACLHDFVLQKCRVGDPRCRVVNQRRNRSRSSSQQVAPLHCESPKNVPQATPHRAVPLLNARHIDAAKRLVHLANFKAQFLPPWASI